MTSEEVASYFEELIECADFVDASYTDCVKVDAIRTAFKALQERKTGKWVIRGGIHNMYTCYACSECGRGIEMYYDFGNIPTDADVINEFPYCHCGAKMEVDE